MAVAVRAIIGVLRNETCKLSRLRYAFLKSDHSETRWASSIANNECFPAVANDCTFNTFSGFAIHSGVIKMIRISLSGSNV